jgi:integrase
VGVGGPPDANRTIQCLIAVDPLAHVRAPRIPHGPERYATWREVTRFFRFCWARVRAQTPMMSRFNRLQVWLMRFVAMTGCRPDEAARATWESVNWGRGTITIEGKTTGVTGRQRVIFLNPKCLRLLRAIHRFAPRDPPIAGSPPGVHLNAQAGTVQRVARCPERLARRALEGEDCPAEGA